MKLHPSFLERDGRRAFAVLAIEEYEALLERLDDLADDADLRVAEREDAGRPTVPLERAIDQLGLRDAVDAADREA